MYTHVHGGSTIIARRARDQHSDAVACLSLTKQQRHEICKAVSRWCREDVLAERWQSSEWLGQFGVDLPRGGVNNVPGCDSPSAEDARTPEPEMTEECSSICLFGPLSIIYTVLALQVEYHISSSLVIHLALIYDVESLDRDYRLDSAYQSQITTSRNV
jgi:hypothetical protein